MVSVDRLQGLSGDLGVKCPVRVATTANITLSGLQTIDGITVVADDRVLVKDQTTGADNGVWVASSSSWSRAEDFNGPNDIRSGTLIVVAEGTVSAGFTFRIATTGTITIGTTALTFSHVFNNADELSVDNDWGAVYLKTVSDIFNGDEVLIDRFLPSAEIPAIRAGTSTYDCGADLTDAFADFTNGGGVYAKYGTYLIETADIDMLDNFSLRGDGRATKFRFNHSANPAASEFMFALRRKSGVTIRDLTLQSNAYDDALFDLGTYDSGTKVYTGGDAGNINLLVISSCSDIRVHNVELYGANYHGIRVTVEGATANDYNTDLKFTNLYGHHCRVAPLDILGTKGFLVADSTFTDNGLFTAGYIDGSTGYGVSLGRKPSGSQLRSFGGICAHNHCARNARHGIDIHAGGNITIANNHIWDNLLQGVGVQDNSGSADDTLVGDVTIEGNQIWHTSAVESQYSLISYSSGPTERSDSAPIFVSRVGGSLLQSATINGNTIRNWRFRQLTANTTGDLIGPIFCSVVDHATIEGNKVLGPVAGYYPSVGLEVECTSFNLNDNVFDCTQRSTVDKPFWKFDADTFGVIDGNYFKQRNVYSDSGTTQAAYPMFWKVAGDLIFTDNTIVQSTQGIRGSVWYTTGTNHLYGFNGLLSVNQGNQFYAGGATLIEYASRIKGSLTLYVKDVAAYRPDGLSSGNEFGASSAAAFLAIINDMPYCESGLTITIEDDQLDWGSDAGITIPDWQDNITFRGLSSETALAATKTGGIKTTGDTLITCPARSNNINFEYLYLKSAGAQTIKRPANVTSCAIEATAAAQHGLYCEYKSSYVTATRFKGPGGTSVAMSANLGARIVSQANDSDAAQFAYGLNSNSGAIYKNSTQPTGSTANELTQNGGTIA